MFKRPEKPMAPLAFGVVFLVVSLALLPLVLADPFDTSPRGIPVVLLDVVLAAFGVYFLLYGAYWAWRDKHPG
ncbi:hypothetical protein ACFXP7_04370 [Microbacterium sp. P06]|uniref:hypothetical protein n=1 Tax=unclassified Microbacterium TaxID=2609290 RepID=UPI003744F326